nr:MAG TPA: hypothetical protein [Caudoviricetes sp.]DAU87494.1 MAG TPA: hypothetical protein [Caudoviricetes sp.]
MRSEMHFSKKFQIRFFFAPSSPRIPHRHRKYLQHIKGEAAD